MVKDDLLTIQTHPKHLSRLQDLYGSVKNRKTCLPSTLPSDDRNDVPANAEESAKYRTAVGILQYISPDVPQAQFGIRHLSQFAANPSRGNVKELQHVLVFLQTTAEWSVGLQPKPLGEGVTVHDPGCSVLEVQSDSDWAGCHKTRRSTTELIPEV